MLYKLKPTLAFSDEQKMNSHSTLTIRVFLKNPFFPTQNNSIYAILNDEY